MPEIMGNRVSKTAFLRSAYFFFFFFEFAYKYTVRPSPEFQ